MDWLYEQIQVEQDQKKLGELCNELLELLEKKRNRLSEKLIQRRLRKILNKEASKNRIPKDAREM